MNDHDDNHLEKPDPDQPLFAVVGAIVPEQHHWAGKDLGRVGEIQAVLAQIGFALGPSQVNLMASIYTPSCVYGK